MLSLSIVCLLLSFNVIDGKLFKQHGRYETLAKQEYMEGLQSLNNDQPDGVLTSLTGIDGMIVVTWFTIDQSINQTIDQSIKQTIKQSSNQSIYWGYQPNHYEYQSVATSKVWIDPSSSWNNRSIDQSVIRSMHQSYMTNVDGGSIIYYRVGSISQSIKQMYDEMNDLQIINHLFNQANKQSIKKLKLSINPSSNRLIDGLSDELIFNMPPDNQTISLIVYGDMGVVNAQSMQSIKQEITGSSKQSTTEPMSHMILHLGDYAYDLHTNNGTLGDVFMHNLQPISSRVPYMGCEGNHEGKYNASHYTNRFWAYNMLGRTSRSDTNWWFSWDYVSGGARVHFVAINTEMYYTYVDEFAPPDYHDQRVRQYEWLKQDLTKATTGKNKADWIFVYGHRPMYCSDVDSLGDCTSDATLLRQGWPGENNGMDPLLAEFSVDIYFTAHEHSYERTYPVSLGKIDLAQQNHTYINPLYPVHIITGSAGCSEELEWFDPVNFAAWSMVRSATYGYGHLIIHNQTHLYWDQLIDEGRQGRDHLWIIKDPKVKRFDEREIKTATE